MVRVILCVAMMMGMTGMSFTVAGEDFDELSGDRWNIHIPTFAALIMHDDELRLESGAHIFLKKQAPDAAEYVVKWAWEAQSDKIEDADALTFILRSNGKVGKTEPRRITDGLQVTISTGAVTITGTQKGKTAELKKAAIKNVLVPVEWHHIRVVDAGNELLVFIEEAELPVVTCKYDPKNYPGKIFGMTNRRGSENEKFAGYIREFTLTPGKK